MRIMNNLQAEKKFLKVEKLSPRRKEMTKAAQWSSLKVLIKVILKEVGLFRGSLLLLRTLIWDIKFNKPDWRPEYFSFRDENDEKAFKETFEELVALIVLFNNLKGMYGEFIADEITSKIAIPFGLPHILTVFIPGTRITNIHEIRQLMSDFLGDQDRFEWTEEVSKDQSVVRYNFTKCTYIMILQAHGLQSYAAYDCLADHVVGDCIFSEDIIFSRKHTIANGDGYCDHTFRMRVSPHDKKEEIDYEDCRKVKFGARDCVEHWKEVFKLNGGKFKF